MEQLLPYFREAEKVLDKGEWGTGTGDSEEEKNLFIQNVLIEMDGLEYRLSFHHDGSKLVEKFLEHASEYQLRVFFEKLGGTEKVEQMALHRYASHVIEKWIMLAMATTEHSDKGRDEGLLSIMDILLLLETDLFRPSFLSLTENHYATHVTRKFLNFYKNKPDSLSALIEKLVQVKLVHVVTNPQQAPTIVRLLEVVCGSDNNSDSKTSGNGNNSAYPSAQNDHNENKAKLLNLLKPKSEREFIMIASDPSGSAFLEGLIHHLQQEDRKLLLDMLFKEKDSFATLLKDPNANYVLQAFLLDKQSLLAFPPLMHPFVESLISSLNRPGLLIRMASLTLELRSAFGEDELESIIGFIVSHFQSSESSILENILRMGKSLAGPISNAGSSLLIILGDQSFRELKALKFIRKNLKEFSSSLLLEIAQHRIASRFLELILDDREWSKKTPHGKETIKRFLEVIEPMSLSGPASHVLEKVWKWTDGPGRLIISKALSEGRPSLEKLPWGRQLLRKFEIEDWERLGADEMLLYWKEQEEKDGVRKRMLSDILGSPSDSSSAAVVAQSKKKRFS